MVQIKRKSLDLGLMMKFVSAEYSLDGSKIVIVFSSEERVDFRQFLKDLAIMLKTRIELKQIGQRDEVKVIGGVGPCGEPCCCARFLKDFEHVTVKMAKVQGLSLSPTKINGICGRLMCCLGYESTMYEETLSRMPKIGTELVTPNGKGNVVYNDILRERVSVKRMAEGDTFIVEDFALEDINLETKIINPKPMETKTQTNEKVELEIQFEKPEKKEQKSQNKEFENKKFNDAKQNKNNENEKAEKSNKHHFRKNKFHNKNKQKS
jgi:cell fate regulator YaaT (PSP1 superfamily)